MGLAAPFPTRTRSLSVRLSSSFLECCRATIPTITTLRLCPPLLLPGPVSFAVCLRYSYAPLFPLFSLRRGKNRRRSKSSPLPLTLEAPAFLITAGPAATPITATILKFACSLSIFMPVIRTKYKYVYRRWNCSTWRTTRPSSERGRMRQT